MIKSSLKKWSIRRFLFIYTFVLLSAFIAFTLIFIFNWYKANSNKFKKALVGKSKEVTAKITLDRQKLIKEALTRDAEYILEAFVKLLPIEKPKSLSSILDICIKNRFVKAIQLKYPDISNVAAAWKTKNKVFFGTELPVKYSWDNFCSITKKISINATKTVTIILYYDISDKASKFIRNINNEVKNYVEWVNAIFKKSQMAIFIILFCALIAGLVSFALFSDSLIIKPLLSLYHVAQKIKNGDLKARASENEVVELSLLAQCLNEMTEGFETSITQMQESRAKAVKEEKYVRTILDSIQEAVISLDSEFKIQRMNKAAKELLNFKDNKNYKNKNINELIKAYKISNKKIKERIEIITSSDITDSGILKNKQAQIITEKAKYYVEFTVAPIIDENRELFGFVIVMHNITDTLLQQEYLRETKKMETVGLLAGGVAHDFNNILQIIMTSVSILMNKAKDNNECQVMLSSIADATRRGKELVGQLLLFSRRKKAKLELANLTEVVINFMKMIKRIINEDIDICVNILSSEKIIANVDSRQIEQIIMNLCMNAKDAMPKGGKIEITVSTEKVKSELNIKTDIIKPGEYGVISVKDTGTGISENIINKIFEPFFTTKEFKKGTGLGLAIVYGIIKEHNGYINVISTEGKGTEFKIYIPLVNQRQNTSFTELKVEKNRSSQILKEDFTCIGEVLLAEDDPIVRMLTVTSLREMGLSVIESDNGMTALEYFIEYQDEICLLLLDVIMPKMSGFKAFEAIREIRPDMPAIFTSGYAEDKLKIENEQLINVKFIQKPYDIQELIEAISQLLNTKE